MSSRRIALALTTIAILVSAAALAARAPAKFAGRPVLTPAEAEAIEEDVASRPGRDDRSRRGTERDVAQAHNQHWLAPPTKLANGRTSLIVDPADGKVPPMIPEALRSVRPRCGPTGGFGV